MPGVEVEEVVTALDIPSAAERHCLECMRLHGVVPAFMGVDILSKLNEEMLG